MLQKRNSFWFLVCSAFLGAVLLAYSQTFAFSWDEGFHLLAAQLIKAGRQPYLDFALAQTPLNAYWNAGWMRVFGEKWRAIQVIDALLTTAAIMLAAGFLSSRWKERSRWGIVTLVLAGTSPIVFEFGAIGQAYAIGMLLVVSAFRLTTECVRRNRTWFAALAGFCSAAAAGSTLLTAPAVPVLLLWIILLSPPKSRLVRAAVFLGGALVAVTPILVLFAQSPVRVVFDVFRYHMFFRRSDWPGSTQHDLEVFASWIDAPRGILFAILAASGLWFISRKSRWQPETKREFYLAGWLALALGLYVSTAHPTFTQYYIFTIPFLAILSAVGLYAVSDRLSPSRANWIAAAVCVWACLGVAKDIYDKREDQSWPGMETLARKVDVVTAPGAPLYADEHIYFLTKRTPPRGNEYMSSHKLRLPKPLSETVHIVPQPEWDRRILAGEFATVETCEDEDWIKERKLTEIYKQKEEVSQCTVFWDRVTHPSTAVAEN